MNARNYSIYAIPAAWFLAQVISPSSTAFISRREEIPPEKVDVLKRRAAVYTDSLETFPLFALSMVVGNEAGLDSGTLNLVGAGYLVSRSVYACLECYLNLDMKGYFRYPGPDR